MRLRLAFIANTLVILRVPEVTTLPHRDLMMDKNCRCNLSCSLAWFTKGLLSSLGFAYQAPSVGPIQRLLLLVNTCLPIYSMSLTPMHFAVSSRMVRQLRTTTMPTSCFEFRWHYGFFGGSCCCVVFIMRFAVAVCILSPPHYLILDLCRENHPGGNKYNYEANI